VDLHRKLSPVLVRGWQWTVIILWILVLFSLPITSFHFIVRLTGAIVAPLSMVPLAILVLIWFFPYLLRRGELPVEGGVLAVFGLVVIAISAYAFFLDLGYIKGKTLLPQTLRSLLPLFIGLAYYFLFSAWSNTTRRLRRTLQAIQIGGARIVVVCWPGNCDPFQ
jgi:hypothetical protein